MSKQNKPSDTLLGEEVVLIITGCVCPTKDQRFLVLSDDDERLRQYLDSINFYIERSPFSKIVFCDNSAYTYDSVQKLIDNAEKRNKTFEWLSFQGNSAEIKEHGKGYGEGEIISYALSHSTSLMSAKSMAKVTGRLKVSNIDKVVSEVKEGCNYFNRDIYRGHGIDTRFYLCDKDYYCEHLMELYLQTCELPGKEIALEDLFYRVLKKVKNYRSLKAYPAVQGISGGNGRDYSKIPSLVIFIYSVFCRVNWFDPFCVFILGIKKCWLTLTGKC